MAAMTVRARFNPQTYTSDYADPAGDTEWVVSPDYFAELYEDLGDVVLDDASHGSDLLRWDPAAPAWVREWSGPYWIDVLDLVEVNAQTDASGPGLDGDATPPAPADHDPEVIQVRRQNNLRAQLAAVRAHEKDVGGNRADEYEEKCQDLLSGAEDCPRYLAVTRMEGAGALAV